MNEIATAADTNRARALRAALMIVGTQGIRGLTHSRVDVFAELPRGSTSNYFRTRASLLHGVVDHLATTELVTFAGGVQPQTVEELVKALTGFVREATGPGRTLAAARLVFFTEAFHDPEIRGPLEQARDRVHTSAAQILELLGVSRPFEAAQRVLAYVDGAILQGLVFGDVAGVERDLDAVVRSCLA
ncbi:hypothetical protein GCM10011490_28860 [Pseudoclavibacter endophyticus]|uniref:TetR family transcriptional regulator n=1 Tax=Pseudoclavibacter endophyticus TaxID=1778590 RepID=A0A6H9WLU3_9MICO|nr:TetR family transcriptional regulator C-terminal domain-containing protein [Pseudoclavibacter endophyticus]KAB1646700.1 TetR family transcriptional regulator [Pseudoclavibacter endophyticus]GGA76305.1 hypothetical protein GCM10011490_28860 [Pseudoclavibacter endophyticus]